VTFQRFKAKGVCEFRSPSSFNPEFLEMKSAFFQLWQRSQKGLLHDTLFPYQEKHQKEAMQATKKGQKRKVQDLEASKGKPALKSPNKAKKPALEPKKESVVKPKIVPKQPAPKEEAPKQESEETELPIEETHNVEKVEETEEKEEVNATFESLGIIPELIEACKLLGWTNPTSIQRESIPVALSGS
jgi:ATP-dependent RNA helicase DDX47/RRP3